MMGGRLVKLFENWVPDFNIDRDAYLKRYFQLQPGTRREILTWRPALMAGVAAWRERRRV